MLTGRGCSNLFSRTVSGVLIMWLICTLLIISIRMIQVGLKYNEARKARLAAAKISSDEKTQRELAAALILQKVARRRAVEERKGNGTLLLDCAPPRLLLYPAAFARPLVAESGMMRAWSTVAASCDRAATRMARHNIVLIVPLLHSLWHRPLTARSRRSTHRRALSSPLTVYSLTVSPSTLPLSHAPPLGSPLRHKLRRPAKPEHAGGDAPPFGERHPRRQADAHAHAQGRRHREEGRRGHAAERRRREALGVLLNVGGARGLTRRQVPGLVELALLGQTRRRQGHGQRTRTTSLRTLGSARDLARAECVIE